MDSSNIDYRKRYTMVCSEILFIPSFMKILRLFKNVRTVNKVYVVQVNNRFHWLITPK
jgi:peroxiredoxin